MLESKKVEEEFFKCRTEEEALGLLKGVKLPNVVISIHDRNGAYERVSDTVKEFWGYLPTDLIGNSAYDYFHPESVQDVLRSHATVNIRPGVMRVDYRIRTADAMFINVHTLSKTIARADGSEFILALTM
jgi:PAS domain S-box-containing protein